MALADRVSCNIFKITQELKARRFPNRLFQPMLKELFTQISLIQVLQFPTTGTCSKNKTVLSCSDLF